MFSNFIYFIVVLLIYSTYQSSEKTNFTGPETLFLFVCLIVLFTAITWLQFYRVEKQILKQSPFHHDHKFRSTLTRQSVLAILLFSIDIYGLNLTSFLINVPFFNIIPTFQALLFLALFTGYLAIVWACAYNPYRRLYPTDLPRKTYILSQISSSIPILLPWLLLSGIADIVKALPFDLPKRFLSTTEGEITYFLVFLFFIAILGPVMIQKFWRCKPLEIGYHRRRIEELCRKAGLEYANILYWPIFGGKMITAAVMGLVKKFRYILVTQGLLHMLEPEEIDAVIAHEIGHIKKKHLLFYLLFFVGYMIISYATFNLLIYSIVFSETIYKLITSTGLDQTAVTTSIFSLVIIIVFLIYFRFIFGYFMRNFERQADTYVYALFDSAKPLISTFEKIAASSGEPPDRPNWHHFSITRRIEYLKKCESDRIWITRHENKIKKSIVIYLAGILLLCGVGYSLNFGENSKKLNKHFFLKIIQREIEKTPDNPLLYSTLGDLYYSNNNFFETIKAYEQSLRIDVNNTHALNNLAWLYATCEIESFRNPKKALELAKRAAQLEESPHILDTLAESYYVNGQFEQAIATEHRALEMATKNRDYYKKQLLKFKLATQKRVLL
ncbi:MAG: M48 family metalloprotease [Deltaproteobacteria bacterium]|jgi:Zn-dependent protease with chaperone function|nr:M48 family metalloprotease [Deltaproteobacteria bacterium]